MTSQLDPEEVQAIADAMDTGDKASGTSLDVTERDFGIPKRLSGEVIKKLESTLRNSIPSLKRSLQSVLPAEFLLEPTSVREMTALGLFDKIQLPFVVARFTSQGAPGWVSWSQEPALACVQAALGMSVVAPEADDEEDQDMEESREFSFIERRVLGRLIEAILTPLSRIFKFDIDDILVAEKEDDIGSWEDAGSDADAHRLCIDLDLQALGTKSTLTLYLPGFHSKDVEEEEEANATEAPQHLESIPVELRAVFDTVEVPLSQLLDLEVGDILPLSPTRSTSITIKVGEEAVARGELGRNFERLAVSVLEVFDPPDTQS
jgi:flagellar motor switch protein FliM